MGEAFRVTAPGSFTRLLPGLLLCVAVTLVAKLLQNIEVRLSGQPYTEALVLSIILGVLIEGGYIVCGLLVVPFARTRLES